MTPFDRLHDFVFIFYSKLALACTITEIKLEICNYSSMRYDTIRQRSLTWTRKLSIQLYLAYVAKKTKTNNASDVCGSICAVYLRSERL